MFSHAHTYVHTILAYCTHARAHAHTHSIDSHLRSSLSKSVREKVLYLSHLITLSERMGPSLPNTLEGPYTAEFNAKIKTFKRKADSSTFPEPPRKQPRLSSQPRWRMVENMGTWCHTPLGACPDQTMTPTCFDLPLSVNSSQKNKKRTGESSSLVLVQPTL